MKRFAAAYLFAIVVVTLLANLVFILLYGRQFFYDAAILCTENCSGSVNEPSILLPLLGINTIVLILFIFGYFVARLLMKTNK